MRKCKHPFHSWWPYHAGGCPGSAPGLCLQVCFQAACPGPIVCWWWSPVLASAMGVSRMGWAACCFTGSFERLIEGRLLWHISHLLRDWDHSGRAGVSWKQWHALGRKGMTRKNCAGGSGCDSEFTAHCLDASSSATKVIIIHRLMWSLMSARASLKASSPSSGELNPMVSSTNAN